uniref:Legume lectin domain-containing protein n=1 Tax=Oryza meridionalis TaxID=40149 RepID=A0A0E0DBK6_9ORYZ
MATPLLATLLAAALLASPAVSASGGTIVFTTLGRSRYEFNIFSLPLSPFPHNPAAELHLTDGVSVNYNGNFAPASHSDSILFVSERNSSLNLYLSPIAFVGLPGMYVVNSDDSGGRRKIFSGNAFPTSWDWKRNA